MSETTPQSDPSGEDQASDMLVPDDHLPDDLNPELNPLARQPDEDEDEGASPNTEDGPDAAAAAPGA